MKTLAEQMYKLFPSSPKAHGEMKLGQKSEKTAKVGGNHNTQPTPPTVELWEKHLTGKQSIGCIPILPDNKCLWGCIDIDDYSGLDHAELEKRIDELGYPLTVCRSKSGGAHLILRLLHPYMASKIRGYLKEFVAVLKIDKYDLFPKQDTVSDDSVGNWLNMPYFHVDKTNRYAVVGGVQADINTFIQTVTDRTVTLDDLKALKSVKEDGYGSIFKEAPPCLRAVIHSEGGKIQAGNRNEMMYNFGVLAKLSTDDVDKEGLIEELQKYNTAFIQPPLSVKEITALAGQLIKAKSCFYKCNADPLVSYCDKQVCKSKEYGLGNTDPETSGANIPHVQLYKYASNPPIWEIDIDGVRSRLTDPRAFMSQTEMDKLMVNSISKRLPPMKPVGYRLLTQKWLDNQILLEMPEDASILGEFISAFREYCFEDMVASNKKEIANGYVWHEDDMVYVTTAGTIRYLRSIGLIKYDRRDVLATFKYLGADKMLLRYAPPTSSDNGVVQVWGIPKVSIEVAKLSEHADE